MHGKHQLPFDYIFFGAVALGVFDNLQPCFVVGIHEVSDISTGALDKPANRFTFAVCTAVFVLGRDEGIRHLLAEVGDKPGALPQLELRRAAMLFFRGVFADTACSVLVALDGISPASVSKCN